MNLQQFRDWALAQGQVAKYDDGQYLGECVSLVNQYCYRVLNVPAGAWGHAYAWANDNNPNRQYFDKVGSPQDGDVIVYGTNFTPLFGHIGIFIGGQLLDQNGHKIQHVAVGVLFNGYNAILRRKGGAPPPPQGEVMTPNDIKFLFPLFVGRPAQQIDVDSWTNQPYAKFINEVGHVEEYTAYQKKVQDALVGGSNSQYEKVEVYRRIA